MDRRLASPPGSALWPCSGRRVSRPDGQLSTSPRPSVGRDERRRAFPQPCPPPRTATARGNPGGGDALRISPSESALFAAFAAGFGGSDVGVFRGGDGAFALLDAPAKNAATGLVMVESDPCVATPGGAPGGGGRRRGDGSAGSVRRRVIGRSFGSGVIGRLDAPALASVSRDLRASLIAASACACILAASAAAAGRPPPRLAPPWPPSRLWTPARRCE